MRKFSFAFLPILLSLILCDFAMAQEPAGYYKSAEGKNKKGLLVALRSIVGPHKEVGYKGLWEVYKTSDVRDDGFVWDMYSTTNFKPGQKQCGNYTQVGDCYNREHSFPKSWFDDKSPMYSDAYHIYPTDGKVNGQRSAFPYGECANGTTLPANGSNKALGKLGTSTFPGYSGKVFEPIDEYKGDFARTYFYMASAYNDKISIWNSDMLSHDDYPCYTNWAISLLLKWDRQDPVSKKEIDRNNEVSKFQKNRNPFIDHPELAEYIWGNKTNEGWIPGGKADPILVTPTDGQSIDMGVTSVSRPITFDVIVKGAGLTKDLNATLGNTSSFTILPTTLGFDAVNSQIGATIRVTYQTASAGTNSTTLTISSSEVSSTITLKATTYDGIPALSATNITTDAFTANWIDITNTGNYTLNVFQADGVTSITGYPVSVPANAQKHDVTGLEYNTTYKYQLSNSSISSNVVSVTTATPTPVLTLIYSPAILNFSALPNAVSAPIEVTVFTEYITENITATVTGPFELSLNKSDWANSLQINPEGENFYIRLKATATEGTYSGVVSIATPTIDGDEADLNGVVSAPRSFFEDFESIKSDKTYSTGSLNTPVCKWMLQDVGFFGRTADRYHGKRAACFDKSSNASIAMDEDKLNGASRLSFFAGIYGSDDDVTIDVMYSTDGGSNWVTLKTEVITEHLLKEFSYTVNIATPVRFKIQKTAGKRLNIDDIAISDFASVTAPSVSQDWDAYATNGTIILESSGKSLINIYSLDAIPVYQGTPQTGKTTIDVPAGLYIVVSGDNSKKVIVK
ncbi:MAG: endonuclease [Muribaculaceae bacterium]